MSRKKRKCDDDNPHGWQQYGWVKIESARIYLPSPQEIARKCAELRAAWPPGEYAKRAPHLFPSEEFQAVHRASHAEMAAAMGP